MCVFSGIGFCFEASTISVLYVMQKFYFLMLKELEWLVRCMLVPK